MPSGRARKACRFENGHKFSFPIGEVGHGPLPGTIRSEATRYIRRRFSLIARSEVDLAADPLIKVRKMPRGKLSPDEERDSR